MSLLITGVSGYVGSWCLQKALEADYAVVGTVRDPNSQKCAFLRDAMEGKSAKISSKAGSNLKLVKADLLSGDEAWEAVFQAHPEIAYVLHTASPFWVKEPKDPNEIIKPAVQGTTSVLKAAIKYNVKRVVITSSVAAVMDPIVDGNTYTHESWSVVEEQSTYSKSKTLAEKAAWDLVKGTSTELSVVNPMFILGPTLYSDKALIDGFESGMNMSKVCNGQMGAVPKMAMGTTDVRDVAEAHMRALTNPDAPGKRFICANKVMWFKDLQAKFAKEAGVKAASQIPSCLFCCIGLVMPEAKKMGKSLDKMYVVDASQTNQVLGFEFIAEDTTVHDMVEDFRALGVMQKK